MDELKMFVIFLLALLVSSCGEKKSSFNHQESFLFEEGNNSLFIANENEHSTALVLKINKSFPLQMTDFSKEIKTIAIKESIELPEAAWRYVLANTFHKHPPSQENWIHRPELFLNSLGGGMCDDLSSVLAHIWKYNGNNARVINLNGHVVPEVYYKNSWHMYDPDLGFSVCTEDVQGTSIIDLEKKPEMLFDKNYLCHEALLKHPLIFSNTNFAQKISSYYASSVDNEDISSWALNNQSPLDSFIIPGYSRICIQTNFITKEVSLSLILSEKSKGKIYLPLIPFSFSGKFKLQTLNNTINLQGNEEAFPLEQTKLQMTLVSVEEASSIHFSINPKVFPFDSLLSIALNSNYPLKIYQGYQNHMPLYPVQKELLLDSIKQEFAKKDFEIDKIFLNELEDSITNLNVMLDSLFSFQPIRNMSFYSL